MGEIQAPMSVGDRIAERIKRDFVDLVPEEDWKKMVREQLQHFTCPKSYGYNDQRPSPLVELIRRELDAMFVEKIKGTLNSSECVEWEDPSEFLKSFIAEHLDKIMASMMAHLSKGFVEQLSTALSQRQY